MTKLTYVRRGLRRASTYITGRQQWQCAAPRNPGEADVAWRAERRFHALGVRGQACPTRRAMRWNGRSPRTSPPKTPRQAIRHLKPVADNSTDRMEVTSSRPDPGVRGVQSLQHSDTSTAAKYSSRPAPQRLKPAVTLHLTSAKTPTDRHAGGSGGHLKPVTPQRLTRH